MQCSLKYFFDIAEKMKYRIKDFFSKCDQICSFMWVWSHSIKKSLNELFIFYASRILYSKTWI